LTTYQPQKAQKAQKQKGGLSWTSNLLQYVPFVLFCG